MSRRRRCVPAICFDVKRLQSPLLRTVEARLRRFDQERRNARMIGELVVRQLESRLRPVHHGDPVSVVDEEPDVSHPVTPENTPEVDRWSLLGAAELVALIDDLDTDELRSLDEAERCGRNRAAVRDAIARRLGYGNS